MQDGPRDKLLLKSGSCRSQVQGLPRIYKAGNGQRPDRPGGVALPLLKAGSEVPLWAPLEVLLPSEAGLQDFIYYKAKECGAGAER